MELTTCEDPLLLALENCKSYFACENVKSFQSIINNLDLGHNFLTLELWTLSSLGIGTLIYYYDFRLFMWNLAFHFTLDLGLTWFRNSFHNFK